MRYCQTITAFIIHNLKLFDTEFSLKAFHVTKVNKLFWLIFVEYRSSILVNNTITRTNGIKNMSFVKFFSGQYRL